MLRLSHCWVESVTLLRQSRLGRFTSRRFQHSPTIRLTVPSIPKNKLDISFCKSSGPGGQNVNKVNTQVEVRFTPATADWIGKELKQQFLTVHASKLTKTGEIVIKASGQRQQESNLKEALERLQELLEEASEVPRERIETKPPGWAKERRLQDKKFRSELKKMRQRVTLD
eukprot:TRINITY_DN4720_c0_g1_i7.p1 TRINITY_DN4720_c0_g1~~TRINITY_DN4720_c0_g1_i7.p1  ORF type:complete len:171 (-),score=39.77 TRINITY_DN4720_c0_g1_i7:178-690(-)